MAGLSNLCTEIQELVLDKVTLHRDLSGRPFQSYNSLLTHQRMQISHLDGPLALKTLKNTSLVCRKWYLLASPRLFRRIVPRAPEEPYPEAEDQLRFLSSCKLIPPHIKQVVITTNNMCVLEEWCLLVEKLLAQFESLRWVGYVSSIRLRLATRIVLHKLTHI
jgi:hypothetical protein